jgi:hypothetical protein
MSELSPIVVSVNERLLPAMTWQGTTMRPMAWPTPALVGITDTNALASRACNAARNSAAESLFAGLARTGRSNTYVSELVLRLPEVARKYPGLDLRDVERVLWADVMPSVPVIDLAVGDYLHPRIRGLMRIDREMPRRLRGDPDDIGTAALAEFIAPSVIISADSVFTRFGLANTVADTWLPMAYGLLRAAGFEATLTETAYFLELAGRLVAIPIRAAVSTARRSPFAALGIGAAIIFLAWHADYLTRDRLRAVGREVGKVAAEGLEAFATAYDGYEQGREALRVVEPYGSPTLEEIAARYLARVRHPVSVRDLAVALERRGHSVGVAELKSATDRHPAFWTRGKSPRVIGVGRIAEPERIVSLAPLAGS